jgi:alpha-beta hydrolase superfamily lysophospholipase
MGIKTVSNNRAKMAFFCILLPIYPLACSTVSFMTKDNNIIETKIWHEEPKQGRVKAVVLLLHGLNLKPDRMNDWSTMLSSHGAQVIRFALYGHTGDIAHMRRVKAAVWRSQFEEVVKIAKSRAEEDGVPLYFIGFSLGALIGLEWLSRDDTQPPSFEKMVLIAPALSVPWYSRTAIKMLSVFGQGFFLPSRSPENYRANKGTSIAAYEALFSLKASLEERAYNNANVSTLVLIDRQDELIDSRAIRAAIAKFHLSNWTLEIVDNRFAYDNYGFRHLMVDEAAIGKDLWAKVRVMVLKHLELG